MPRNDSWEQIHSDPNTRRIGLPSVPRLSIPRVHNPVHPDHCGNRHERDGFLYCPEHKSRAYEVIAHSWFHDEGMYWYTLAPMNGAPMPPLTNCPDCQRPLVRGWDVKV